MNNNIISNWKTSLAPINNIAGIALSEAEYLNIVGNTIEDVSIGIRSDISYDYLRLISNNIKVGNYRGLGFPSSGILMGSSSNVIKFIEISKNNINDSVSQNNTYSSIDLTIKQSDNNSEVNPSVHLSHNFVNWGTYGNPKIGYRLRPSTSMLPGAKKYPNAAIYGNTGLTVVNNLGIPDYTKFKLEYWNQPTSSYLPVGLESFRRGLLIGAETESKKTYLKNTSTINVPPSTILNTNDPLAIKITERTNIEVIASINYDASSYIGTSPMQIFIRYRIDGGSYIDMLNPIVRNETLNGGRGVVTLIDKQVLTSNGLYEFDVFISNLSNTVGSIIKFSMDMMIITPQLAYETNTPMLYNGCNLI
jgi:hypothetical protein